MLLLPIPTKDAAPAARVSANPRGTVRSSGALDSVPVSDLGELIRCRNGESIHQNVQFPPPPWFLQLLQKPFAFMKSVRFLLGGVQNVPRSSWAFAVVVFLPLYRQLYPPRRSALCGAAVRSVSLSELSENPAARALISAGIVTRVTKKPNFSRVGEWFRLLISQKCRA